MNAFAEIEPVNERIKLLHAEYSKNTFDFNVQGRKTMIEARKRSTPGVPGLDKLKDKDKLRENSQQTEKSNRDIDNIIYKGKLI